MQAVQRVTGQVGHSASGTQNAIPAHVARGHAVPAHAVPGHVGKTVEIVAISVPGVSLEKAKSVHVSFVHA